MIPAPTVVVDCGNTRMKWGCVQTGDSSVSANVALEYAQVSTWQCIMEQWAVPNGASWLIGGVNPAKQQQVQHWLIQQGMACWHFTQRDQLPLQVHPQVAVTVGWDRLFAAIAAKHFRTKSQATLIVDCGTATTLNVLDSAGQFLGGAILPGVALMAEALHLHTAALPAVNTADLQTSAFPAGTTPEAIRAGILLAQRGAIQLAWQALKQSEGELFLTGGNAESLGLNIPTCAVLHRPTLVLDGMALAASHGQPMPMR